MVTRCISQTQPSCLLLFEVWMPFSNWLTLNLPPTRHSCWVDHRESLPFYLCLIFVVDHDAVHSKAADDAKTESESRIDAIHSKRIIFDNNPFTAIDTTAPFPELKNHSLLQAALGKKPDRIPVWLHRQAGRYMKEFRDVRLKYTFFEICKTPELVAEVTLQPINAFDLDASIVFSDILVIPPILGLNVNMVKGVGPVFQQKLSITNDDVNDKVLETLSDDEIRRKLSYVYEGT